MSPDEQHAAGTGLRPGPMGPLLVVVGIATGLGGAAMDMCGKPDGISLILIGLCAIIAGRLLCVEHKVDDLWRRIQQMDGRDD